MENPKETKMSQIERKNIEGGEWSFVWESVLSDGSKVFGVGLGETDVSGDQTIVYLNCEDYEHARRVFLYLEAICHN